MVIFSISFQIIEKNTIRHSGLGLTMEKKIVIMSLIFVVLSSSVHAYDVRLIFKALSLGKAVAEFMEIIESTDSKIDKMMQNHLESGLRNLEQADSSTNQQTSLLREARNCFNKAVGMESGYRLGIAYLGLALCHNHLGDSSNSLKALENLLAIKVNVTIEKAKNSSIFYWIIGGGIIGGPLLKNALSSDDFKNLARLQLSVSKYINKPIRWAIENNMTNNDVVQLISSSE